MVKKEKLLIVNAKIGCAYLAQPRTDGKNTFGVFSVCPRPNLDDLCESDRFTSLLA